MYFIDDSMRGMSLCRVKDTRSHSRAGEEEEEKGEENEDDDEYDNEEEEGVDEELLRS